MATYGRFSKKTIEAFPALYPLVIYNQIGTLKYSTKLNPKALAVVTSSSQQKKAVLRNKLKRRIRIVFEKQKPALSAVFYPSKKAYTATFNEITAGITALLEKAQTDTK